MVKGKLLRRRTFLREKDYFKMIPKALACGYHRTEWKPLAYKDIRQELTWYILQGKNIENELFYSTRELRTWEKLPSWQRQMVQVIDDEERFMRQYIHWVKHSKQLYKDSWKDWSWRLDNGTIQLRFFSNQEYETLGVATLERDY